MYRRKYKKGAKIESIQELSDRINNRAHFIYRDRFVHFAYLMNWSVWQLDSYIKQNLVYKAEPTTYQDFL